MIKKIKQFVVTTIAAFALVAPVLAPVSVSAATLNESLNCGTDLKLQDSGCDSGAGSTDKVNGTIELALNLFSAIVGIIAVIMIIVGGIRYITSGGDSGNVTAAKNTILYAVIGLVVVALAQIIVKFVLNRFTS